MNKKKIDKNTTSLYHYTTLDVLLILLDKILKGDNPQDLQLEFHANEVHYMNDKYENGITINDLYLKSKNFITKLQSLKNDLNKIFVISFGKVRDYLPMWFIYGASGSGVSLRFDFNCLRKDFQYCDINKGDYSKEVLLAKCNYKTETNIKQEAKKLRNEFKNAINKNVSKDNLIKILNTIQIKASMLKLKYFNYEEEYRIIKQTKEILYKNGKYGPTMYQTIEIPLNSLREIIVGPMCNQDMVVETLSNISSTIKYKYNVEIKIHKSKCQIK